jgi:putative hydrolase of the HAD superfamily
MKIQGIVFDLDDTLYLEREYVRTGFMAVAESLEERAGLCRVELFSYLWGLFEDGVRGESFDRLLKAYPALDRHCRVADLVDTYRTHRPAIALLPGVRDLLENLAGRGYRMGLLSDGPLVCQQSKVQALGLESHLAPIALTGYWGREYWKPHPRGYEQFGSAWGLAARQLLYVADNPEKDFITPRRLGWRTIRVRMPGQLRFADEARRSSGAAEMEVGTLPAIQEMLEGL